MKRFGLAVAALALVGMAGALSARYQTGRARQALVIEQEDRNPWTNLNINRAPGEFQFAIVSDRTGGHRPNIFSQAVERLNLMQPEFVLSVGDLIEGGKKKPEELAAEWKEFDGYVNRLQMPFFYVPGNHDVGVAETSRLWRQQFGRRHYHFVYHKVLFLVLNTEDPPGAGPGHLGDEQLGYALRVLEENRNVRWTIVALHKPVWAASDVAKTRWLTVEKALANRPCTVFCGHVHRFQKFVRNGHDYYQLATTGGGSRMRGVEYGEFDEILWVSMKKEGPVLAHLLLDSILPEDLSRPKTNEAGVSIKDRKPTFPVRGRVFFEGAPIPQAYVVFTPTKVGDVTKGVRADAMVEADGSFKVSTYTTDDGMAEGEYEVTVTWRRPLRDAEGRPGKNLLPARYAKAESSGLRAVIKPGSNSLDFVLHK